MALPDTWIEARDHVMPLLRSVTAPANALRAARAGHPLASRRLTRHLHLLLAVEDDLTRAYIAEDRLAQWGVTPDQAFDHALSALDPSAGLEPHGDGAWSLGMPASRVVLPGFLEAFADRVQGEPLAFVPTARTLIVTGSEHPRLPELLEASIAAYQSEGDAVSPVPYRAGLQPLRVEPDHPLADRLAFAGHLLAGTEYARQADALLEAHDAFEGWLLAPYNLVRIQGQWRSWTCWPHEKTLLPETELVFLGPRELAPHSGPLVTWSDVARLLRPQEDVVLPRWRAEGPPPVAS